MPPRPPAAAATVRQLRALLGHLAEGQPDVAAREQLERVAGAPALQEVLVALLGPISAGKTSLVMAITGVEGLPVGAAPTTHIPTFVVPGRPGARRLVAIGGAPGPTRQALALSSAPGAQARWDRLELEYQDDGFPGLAFIDLPGLGLAGAGKVGERYQFLGRCDVLLLCVPATSPVSPEDCAALAGGVAPQAHRVVALTKADQVEPGELPLLVAHLRATAGLDEAVPVVPVGHRVGRDGRRTRFGVDELVETLRRVAREEVVLPAARAAVEAVEALATDPRRRSDHAAAQQLAGVIAGQREALLTAGQAQVAAAVDQVRAALGRELQSDAELHRALASATAEAVDQVRTWAKARVRAADEEVHQALASVVEPTAWKRASAARFLRGVRVNVLGGASSLDTWSMDPWSLGAVAVGIPVALRMLGGAVPALGLLALIGSAAAALVAKDKQAAALRSARRAANEFIDGAFREVLSDQLCEGIDQVASRWQEAVAEALGDEGRPASPTIHLTSAARLELEALGHAICRPDPPRDGPRRQRSRRPRGTR